MELFCVFTRWIRKETVMVEGVNWATQIKSLKSAVEVVFLLGLYATKRLATTVSSDEYDLKEMLILYFLELYQGRGITQQGLIKVFRLSPSSTYDMVKQFLTKGWVEYAPDERKNGHTILVTDAGRKFLEGYFIKLACVAYGMTEGTPTDDLIACGPVLEKLRPAVMKNLEYGAFGSVSET